MLCQKNNCFLERNLSWTTAFEGFGRASRHTFYHKSPFFFPSSPFLPLVNRYLFKWKLHQILPPLCWLRHKSNSIKIHLATQTIPYVVLIRTSQICF